ncbi:MAG: ABC transporter substrate-binding protein [Dehalococcoidales bacterium]|nr:ABC transporter substrate-binding protein [Dehalococcoidales bacterium]
MKKRFMSKWNTGSIKIFAAVLFVLILAVLPVTACSQEAETSQAPAATATANPDQPVTLTFWRALRFGGEEVMIQKITDEFMAEHPNVTIKIENMPMQGYADKLKVSMASNSLPDMFTVDTHEPAYYAAGGQVLELPEDLSQFARDTLFTGNLNPATWKDKIVALPLDTSVELLAYNVDLVTGANLDPDSPPQDWNELTDWAVKLTKRDADGKIIQAGLDPLYSRKTAWWVYDWVGAAGGKLWSNLDEVDFTEEPFIAAFQFVQDLAIKHKVFDNAVVPNDFVMGRSGMMLFAPWDYLSVQKANPDLNYRLTPVPPREKGGNPGTMIGGWNMVLNKNCQHTDIAWDYFRFIMKKEYRLEWTKLTGRPPVYKDLAEDPAITGDPYLNLATITEGQANIPYGTANAAIYDIYEALQESLERIVWNGEDVETVLTEAKAKADQACQQKNK